MKATIASLLLLTAIHASAAFSINLPGNTETGTWSNLYKLPTIEGNPPPPAPPSLTTLIASSGSSATFTRTSGPAFYTGSGSGIYSANPMDFMGTYPSSFSISDDAPIVDLATIVFQARFNLAPTSILLSLNGATTGPLSNIEATFATNSLAATDIFDHAWQWDLSGVTEEITSYEISFTVPGHGVIYSGQTPISVHTSDSFVQVVPEPTTGLLAIAPLAFVVLRRRRAA